MPAQLQPNRLVVNDRFPMLGFTIRTDGTPQRAEIAMATDPTLFDDPNQRALTNFFSTREFGLLTVPKGEAVYVVPAEVMARFVGAQRLYFGLAAGPAQNGAVLRVQIKPDANSPYVSIGGLTGRGLRQVRLSPRTGSRMSRYAEGGNGGTGSADGSLRWAGDEAQAGGNAGIPNGGNGTGAGRTENVVSAGGSGNRQNNRNGSAEVIDYDDGFGPMPPLPTPRQNTQPLPVSVQPAQPVAQAMELDMSNLQLGETVSARAPRVRNLGLVESTALQAALALNPALTPLVLAARTAAEHGNVSVGIGPAASLELGAGLQYGFGLIFAPGNRMGLYASAELITGLSLEGVINGINVTAQVTVLRGDITSFEGVSYSAGFSVGEGVVGGGSVIFDAQRRFLGVCFNLGVGVSLSPFEVFAGVQRSVAAQLAYAAAFSFDIGNIQLGDRVSVQPPPVMALDPIRSTAVQVILAANPMLTPLVASARAAAELGNVSIAIGPAVTGGFGGGVQLSAGLIFSPGNRLGIYGSYEALAGILASISLTAQVTVLRGGIESFQGICSTVGFSAGEEIVGGGAVILDSQGRFMGISVNLGIGAALSPYEIYTSVQRSVATQLGYAVAFSVELGDMQLGQRTQVTAPSTHTLGIDVDAGLVVVRRINPVLAGMIEIAKATVTLNNIAIGIGPAVSVEAAHGVHLSAGMIIAPNGRLGLYTSGSAVTGLSLEGIINSMSATLQVTVLRGDRGLESFEEISFVAGFSMGEGIVCGGSVIYDAQQRFLGVAFNIGIGASFSPFDIYSGVQRSVAGQLGYSRAFTVDVGQLQLGRRVPERPPSVTTLDGTLSVLVQGYLAANPLLTPLVVLARAAAERGNVSIGIGPAVNGGLGAGLQLSAGVIFAPGNLLGVYGTLEAVAGLIASISLTAQVTILRGGIESFRGISFTAGIQGGEGLVAGGAVVLDSRGGFLGVSLNLGIGAGLSPFEIYGSVQRSVSSQLGYGDPSGISRGSTAIVAADSRRRVQPFSTNESFTVNWDEVYTVAQPTDVSCWAAAASMVVGWKEQISLSPQSVAEIAGRTTATGLDPVEVERFASEMGLYHEEPKSYTVEGFRRLLEEKGPLWVAAAVPGLHAIVVTGLYSYNRQIYVRITDPWDRVVGSPGAPGSYAATHNTGSKYIMRWEDFVAEYERAATDFGSVNIQILHSGGNFGRKPNRGERRPPGYAQSYVAAQGAFRPSWSFSNPSQIVPQNGAGGGNQGTSQPNPTTPFLGVKIFRSNNQIQGVDYTCFLMDGRVAPATPMQAAQELVPGERIIVDEWPYLDGPGGRTKGGIVIDWSHGAGAVANVRTMPAGGLVFDGWQVQVHTDIGPGPSRPDETRLKVTIRTTFRKPGYVDQTGISEVILCGSGLFELNHREESQAVEPVTA